MVGINILIFSFLRNTLSVSVSLSRSFRVLWSSFPPSRHTHNSSMRIVYTYTNDGMSTLNSKIFINNSHLHIKQASKQTSSQTNKQTECAHLSICNKERLAHSLFLSLFEISHRINHIASNWKRKDGNMKEIITVMALILFPRKIARDCSMEPMTIRR